MKMVRCYNDPIAPDVYVRSRDPWISESAYAEIVQKMPIPCTDAIALVRGQKAIYLGQRCVYPMKGVWCLGGRIFFNDRSLEESVSRCIMLETGVKFSEKRFKYLCTNLYSWVKTAQADYPGKNLAPLFTIEVTEAELMQMAHGLKPAEYDANFGLQRFDRTRLVDERVHPAMLDAFDCIFNAK